MRSAWQARGPLVPPHRMGRAGAPSWPMPVPPGRIEPAARVGWRSCRPSRRGSAWSRGTLPLRAARRGTWLLVWIGLVLVGSLIAVRVDIAERRASFEAEARIAHRLLSQRAAQHEAILATLVLL